MDSSPFRASNLFTSIPQVAFSFSLQFRFYIATLSDKMRCAKVQKTMLTNRPHKGLHVFVQTIYTIARASVFVDSRSTLKLPHRLPKMKLTRLLTKPIYWWFPSALFAQPTVYSGDSGYSMSQFNGINFGPSQIY